jgi:hypothetical protein
MESKIGWGKFNCYLSNRFFSHFQSFHLLFLCFYMEYQHGHEIVSVFYSPTSRNAGKKYLFCVEVKLHTSEKYLLIQFDGGKVFFQIISEGC